MPQRQTIPFIGQHAQDRAMAVNNQETLNFITSVKAQGAKSQVVLESAPGLVQLGTAGDGACRSPHLRQWIHPTDNTKDTYGVFGDDLVRITAASGASTVGSLTAGRTTRCRIARGRNYVAVVDGTDIYAYDGTTTVTVSDPDRPTAPTHIVYQDGYFIANDAGTDNWYISAVEDPTSWNALDFEAASVAPDNALALASYQSIVWVLGDETVQGYYNSGNADFPYALILSATQEVGILAPQSLAESSAGVFFVGTSPEGGTFVYRIQGQSGGIISTDAIEYQLSNTADIGNAYGYIYSQAGKSFYVIQLGNDEPSLVYNIKAGVWETRALQDGSAYRIGGAGVFNGQVIGGSRLGALYYRLDLGVYSDTGEEFIRRRVTEVMHRTNQLIDYHQLVIDVQTGVGTASGSGSDPQIRMRYSDDDGGTWSAQLIMPLGKQGQREARVVYNNLGSSRKRLFELEVADPVQVTFIAAYAHVTVLDD